MSLGFAIIDEFRCLLCTMRDALRSLVTRGVTTTGLEIQASGVIDYADPTLLSISFLLTSGAAELNGVPLAVGVTIQYSAEPGALLSGAFSLDCGSPGSTLVYVNATYRG